MPSLSDLPTRSRLSAPAAPTSSIRFATAGCSLGSLLVATSSRGICAILLGDGAAALVAELHSRFPDSPCVRSTDLEDIIIDAIRLVEAPDLGLDAPLDVRGTAFQQRVWQALRDIPAGHTATYSEIAARIGRPSAVRAVASACAANPIAVAIPCHRVLRADGALSGYRWGIDRKRALLDREQSAAFSLLALRS